MEVVEPKMQQFDPAIDLSKVQRPSNETSNFQSIDHDGISSRGKRFKHLKSKSISHDLNKQFLPNFNQLSSVDVYQLESLGCKNLEKPFIFDKLGMKR